MKAHAVPAPLEGTAQSAAYRDARGRWCSEGRRLLALVGQTRAAVGGLLGIEHQSVSEILAGWTRPSLDTARAIEAAFAIPMRTWCDAPSAFAGATCEREADDASMLPKVDALKSARAR